MRIVAFFLFGLGGPFSLGGWGGGLCGDLEHSFWPPITGLSSSVVVTSGYLQLALGGLYSRGAAHAHAYPFLGVLCCGAVVLSCVCVCVCGVSGGVVCVRVRLCVCVFN